MPPGPPGQQFRGTMHQQDHFQQVQPGGPSPTPLGPIGPNVNREESQSAERPTPSVKLPNAETTPAPDVSSQAPPPPPTETKPDIEAALAPPAPVVQQTGAMSRKPASARIMPAIPLKSPGITSATLRPTMGHAAQAAAEAPTSIAKDQPAAKSMEDANRDARAAVAEAMAKLSVGKKPAEANGADNLSKRVNEMRTNEHQRHSRQPRGSGYGEGQRGRGGMRGGRDQGRKGIEIPKTDYDFESANAKFNKQDTIKEAIATGSPLTSPTDETTNGNDSFVGHDTSVPTVGVGYNKSTSFFDNISSEITDRAEGRTEMGGREFRSEERQKNFETFGQGSVDNGYRYRGRGRGRGYGRGRGGSGRGRGTSGTGPRGGQGYVPAES